MRKFLSSTLCRAACCAVLFACSDRMVASKDGTDANKLLLLAASAKTQHLTSEASRDLEARILDEYLKGSTAEEEREFRHALETAFSMSVEPQPDAPDTPEVKQKFALINAFLDLRRARVAAEIRAQNPPIDMTDRMPVQVLFVSELKDTTADAMIYLTPTDTTRPYVVVREQNLKAPDLYRYVRHAVHVWNSVGKSLDGIQSIAVHRDSIQNFAVTEVPAGYQQILDEIAGTRTAEFPGIGKGRTIVFMARKSTSGTAKSRTP